ncbi:hypothetical protein VQ056_32955 [Paenibacillus sp. JTLBN-2024]
MMANVLGVTVSNQWFVKRKGLVVGLLTASAATGQLLFLPLYAKLTSDFGWKYAVYAACGDHGIGRCDLDAQPPA